MSPAVDSAVHSGHVLAFLNRTLTVVKARKKVDRLVLIRLDAGHTQFVSLLANLDCVEEFPGRLLAFCNGCGCLGAHAVAGVPVQRFRSD